MSQIFALAGLNASDYQFARKADQRLVYDAIQTYVNEINASMLSAMSLFVEGEPSSVYTERFKLPISGTMTRRADGTRGAAVRQSGEWDVAYPLYDYDEQLAATDIDWAYMTPAMLDAHVMGIGTRYANLVRQFILARLLKNTTDTFTDKYNGSLTVQCLANGDAVVYPPVIGATTEATDDHYLESGYAASAISDANDPVVTMVDELEEHFGSVTGNSNIVIFHNNAQTAKLLALTAVSDVVDRYITPGQDTAVPQLLPGNVPGKVVGRHSKGAWLVEWRYVPANYMIAVHMDAPRPLQMRVDPVETGLPRGLGIVAGPNTYEYPLIGSEWRARFGLGARNRLNGVVMELGTGGSYTIPTGFTALP